MMKKFLLTLILLIPAPAFAQWQVPNNTVPIGKGAGKVGFGSVAGSGGAGAKCLVDTVPPTFVTCSSIFGFVISFNNRAGIVVPGADDYTASLIKFTAPGVGGQVRTTQTKFDDFTIATDYSTLQEALDEAVILNRYGVYLPCGNYIISTLTMVSGTSLIGQGSACVGITTTSGAGDVITANSFNTIRGVGFSVQSKTITAVTKANPGVVTSAAHGYVNGTQIFITASGMTQINNLAFKVANATTNTYTLTDLTGTPIDTSAYGTFTSGVSILSRTAGAYVKLTGTNFIMEDIVANDPCEVLKIDSGGIVQVSLVNVFRTQYNCNTFVVTGSGSGPGAVYFNNTITGSNADSTHPAFSHILISNGEFNCSQCLVQGAANNLYVNPGNSQSVITMKFISSLFDEGQTSAISFVPTGSGNIARSTFNSIWASNSHGTSNIILDATAGTSTINGIQFIDADVFGAAGTSNGFAISGVRASNITISGGQIANHAIGILCSVCTKPKIIGASIGAVGNYAANTTGMSFTGAATDIIIANNQADGNGTNLDVAGVTGAPTICKSGNIGFANGGCP